ncbi:hypothetical protein BH11MYX2_BH11MYX2_26840 [soil metagenome]
MLWGDDWVTFDGELATTRPFWTNVFAWLWPSA